ncbi:MAG: tyrosine-protein phosphatase [Robiginitomaculum sp.]
MNRILKFDQVLNVRDFGGKVCAAGNIVSNKLYRGAHISKMTPKDISRFKQMGVSFVVDLRYRTERERQASNWGDLHAPSVFEFSKKYDQDTEEKLAPHERFVLHELGDVSDAWRYMCDSYELRPLSPGFIDITARAIKRMAQTGEPIFVHCAAGKDRTGTFAAIVLMILGASYEAVLEDYLLTKKVVNFDKIIKIVTEEMQNRYERVFDPEALKPFFDVNVQYLQKSLSVIGNINDYTANVLKLSEMEIGALKQQYLCC